MRTSNEAVDKLSKQSQSVLDWLGVRIDKQISYKGQEDPNSWLLNVKIGLQNPPSKTTVENVRKSVTL